MFAGASKVALCIVVIALAIAAGRSQAQPQGTPSPMSSGGTKIAVLDLVRVFNETAQIMDLNDKIRQKNEDYSKEASQRKKVMEDRQLELTAFKAGTPDYEARRKNLIRMNIEANVWLKVSEQEIDQMRFDWTKVVYEKAMKVAADVAKESNFDLVMQKTEWKPAEIEQSLQTLRRVIQDRTVIYNHPESDISDTVVQRMDREYKAAGGKSTLGTTSRPAGP